MSRFSASTESSRCTVRSLLTLYTYISVLVSLSTALCVCIPSLCPPSLSLFRTLSLSLPVSPSPLPPSSLLPPLPLYFPYLPACIYTRVRLLLCCGKVPPMARHQLRESEIMLIEVCIYMYMYMLCIIPYSGRI